MDISRLPLAPPGRPATFYNQLARNTVGTVEAVEVVQTMRAGRRAESAYEHVVQGELLQRERSGFQSTQGFISERNFDRAQAAGTAASGAGYQTRAALNHYMKHSQPETPVDLTPGSSVNLFV
jgi:hypothetical protein